MWIDLERMSRSLDREQGIHEPESFDLAGCRAPLAADQLLAEAGGMRMMIFELDDCGPSAMAFGLASAVGHGRSERRSAERRVGKEGVRTWRFRRSPYH